MHQSRSRPRPARAPRATALVAAHPGHELRLHRWLELFAPTVFVLTDGSGHGKRGRLESTRDVLRAAGARAGSVFGPWTDREAYRIILEGDLGSAIDVVSQLVDELVALEVEVVASDAVEGFNPSHDLCFVVAETAVTMASRRLGRPVRHLDFPLEARPDAGSRGDDSELRIELDQRALDAKLDAARAYGEIRHEVDRAVALHTEAAFSLEILRPVVGSVDLVERAVPRGARAPSYELHGEERVADGIYSSVLRLEEHWLPFATAVREWADRES